MNKSKTKVLTEFPNYIIYDDGKIFSKLSNRYLKANTQPKGYLTYRLKSKGGSFITKSAHVLIAMAFLKDYSPKLQVNHMDGNKHNNTIQNLEMVTSSENLKHGYKNNLIPKHYTHNFITSRQKEVIILDHKTNKKMIFKSIKEATQSLKIPRTTFVRYYKQSQLIDDQYEILSILKK